MPSLLATVASAPVPADQSSGSDVWKLSEQLKIDVELLKSSRDQNSLRIDEIQKAFTDLRHDVVSLCAWKENAEDALKKVVQVNLSEKDPTACQPVGSAEENTTILLRSEIMQQVERMQSVLDLMKVNVIKTDNARKEDAERIEQIEQKLERIKQDTAAEAIALRGRLEGLTCEFDKLCQQTAACAADLKSPANNVSTQSMSDSENRLRRVEDSNDMTLEKVSDTVNMIGSLTAKMEMTSVLVSQLFEERCKDKVTSGCDGLPKTRSHSQKARRRGCSNDSRKLDAISEVAGRDFAYSPVPRVNSCSELDGSRTSLDTSSFHQPVEGLGSLGSNSLGECSISPVRDVLINCERNWNLSRPASKAPSQPLSTTSTPLSSFSNTPQLGVSILPNVGTSPNVGSSPSVGTLDGSLRILPISRNSVPARPVRLQNMPPQRSGAPLVVRSQSCTSSA